MTNKKHRAFTRIEMKIFIFNKMKHKGLTYDQAYKELSGEIEAVKKNCNNAPKEKPSFKEEFGKLTQRN
jgi:hypothetical protein